MAGATSATWKDLADELKATLHLAAAPVAISFTSSVPESVPPANEPKPAATPDGRTGRAAAGCVFWIRGAERAFATVAEDHGNCSVGSYTHGFISLEEAATKSDVAALLESGWVTMDLVPGIPAVATRPASVVYGPLGAVDVDPDVVLVRVNGKQMMELSDAIPDMRIEGKPQCHIVPLAKGGQVVASVGCALSRVRTGMRADEMTCAIPASRLGEVVASLKRAAVADAAVARYAALDQRRFAAESE